MLRDITLAFAGHAPNSPANIDALLSDWLGLGAPDAKGYYDKPEKYGTITVYALLTDGAAPKGMKAALNLALSIDGTEVHLVTDKVTGDISKIADAVDEVHEESDPFAYLISQLADGPHPVLMINWDEEDADDEALINFAHEHPEIRVADLVNGLASILPDDDQDMVGRDVDPPAEEPEEAPAHSRRKVKEPQPAEELDERPEDLEETAASKGARKPESLEEDIAAAKRAQGHTQTTLAAADVTLPAAFARDLLAGLESVSFYLEALDNANAVKNLADAVRFSPLTQAVQKLNEELAGIIVPGATEVPYEKSLTETAKPAKKTPGKGTRVIWDEDAGEWKPAGRGRPRAGARLGRMDADGNVTEDA